MTVAHVHADSVSLDVHMESGRAPRFEDYDLVAVVDPDLR